MQKGIKNVFMTAGHSVSQFPMGEGLLSSSSFVERYRFTRCWQEAGAGWRKALINKSEG